MKNFGLYRRTKTDVIPAPYGRFSSARADVDAGGLLAFPLSLVVFVLTVVLLRVALSMALPRVVRWDEPMYLLAGHNLLTGNGFTWGISPELNFTPLYPIVGALVHFVIGDFEKASNLVFALFGGLLLFPVFALTRRIYGVRTAWLAAVLVALFPALSVSVLYWGTMTEPLYLFLIYGGLAVLLGGLEEDRLGMFTAAGALFSLAYLTRPEAVVYFGMFFLLASVWLVARVGIRTVRTWYALGLFALSFVLVAAPYIWYLHAQTGQWMLSGKTNLAWKANVDPAVVNLKAYDLITNGLDSSGKEILWLSPDRFREDTLRTVVANPADLLQRMAVSARNIKDQFFSRVGFWWGLAPLVLLAFFKTPWNSQRLRHEVFLMTGIIALLFVFLPYGFLMRYLAPAFPVLLMWTARGALDLGAWLQETVELCRGKAVTGNNATATWGWVPVGLVAACLIVNTPVAAQGGISSTWFSDKDVGLWLKAHTPANAKIMAQELGIALYADRRYIPSPNCDWARFLAYARAHGANYLVVRDFKLAEYRPELASVIKSGAPELKLVFTHEEPHVQGPVKTFVYQIL